MSPYWFLAIAAVFLFLIVLVIVGMLIKGAIECLVKGYIAHRHYNLIDREFDRNPNVRLDEINEARRYVDGDLPLPLVDDNGSRSPEPQPKSLPAPTEPDS